MNEEFECEIIKDLLPAYVEGLTSEVTNKKVEKHLKRCTECMNYYKAIKSDINTITKEDTRGIKKAFAKTKKMYILNGVFWTMCILSIFIPLLVDFCVNKHFSWSYIVLGGCIIGYSVLRILIFFEDTNICKKIRGMMIVISAAAIPYVYLIQYVVNKYFLLQPVYWFKSIALPILIVWTIATWIIYFMWIKLKKNTYYKISIVSLIVLIGSICTDLIIHYNGYSNNENDIINYIAYLSIFVKSLICALMNEKKSK